MVFARISLEWNKGVSCLSIYAFIASFLVKEVIKYIFIESSHFYDFHDEWLQEKQKSCLYFISMA